MMNYGLGIDLGGSSVKAVAITPEGEILAQTATRFDLETRLDWARRSQDSAEQIKRGQGGSALDVGLSAPGLAAADGRSIRHMPGRLQGLEGLDWTCYLHAPRSVPVLNDAHAALLGEAWLGAAQGF